MINSVICFHIACVSLFCTGMLQMAMAEDVQPATAPMPVPTLEAGSTTVATQVTAVESNAPIPLIVASTNSWFTATNWPQRLDWLHDTANATTEQNIQYADNWFIDDPKNRVPFKSAKIRLGLQVEADYFAHTNKFALRPLADTETEIHMPNAEKRLRLTISTLDPMALPGQDANQGMSGFRVGLRRGMLKDVDTSFGVRLKWLPSIYTYITWDPRYRLNNWGVYPEQKFGWESDEGVYETSSLMFSRWINRWMIRPIASLKLSRKRYKDDMDKLDQERQDAEAAGLPLPDGNYPKGNGRPAASASCRSWSKSFISSLYRLRLSLSEAMGLIIQRLTQRLNIKLEVS